jgi:hypothetical protein
MVEPATIDLRVPAGDTFSQTFRLLDAGIPVDLTGSTVAAELRHPRTSLVVPLAVTVGPDAGEFTLIWGASEPGYGHYRYDVEITDATSIVRTWIKGRFHVERDVTNAAA